MKHIMTMLLLITAINAYGQPDVQNEKKACITIGILQGGGSLVGADLELLLSNRIAVQVGGGFVAFGAALNFHLKPSIRSSFISLNYWHQGAGDSFSQSVIGPTFV